MRKLWPVEYNRTNWFLFIYWVPVLLLGEQMHRHIPTLALLYSSSIMSPGTQPLPTVYWPFSSQNPTNRASHRHRSIMRRWTCQSSPSILHVLVPSQLLELFGAGSNRACLQPSSRHRSILCWIQQAPRPSALTSPQWKTMQHLMVLLCMDGGLVDEKWWRIVMSLLSTNDRQLVRPDRDLSRKEESIRPVCLALFSSHMLSMIVIIRRRRRKRWLFTLCFMCVSLLISSIRVESPLECWPLWHFKSLSTPNPCYVPCFMMHT